MRTSDGRIHEGDIQISEKELIVRTAAGRETRLDIASVVAAKFRDPTLEKRPGNPVEAVHVRGLRGEYFADSQFTDLRTIRLDPAINLQWTGERAPDPAVPKEFSARWTGTIEPDVTDNFTFHLRLNGGAWLWIDGKLVIGRMRDSKGTFTGVLPLKGGQKLDFKLEYHGKVGTGVCVLEWSAPRRGKQAIPPERLAPPAGTVPPSFKVIAPIEGSQVAQSYNVLEVEVLPGQPALKNVEFFCDYKPIGSVSAAPWRLMWKDAPLGAHSIKVKVTSASGVSALTESIHVNVLAGGGKLPAPWASVFTSAKHRAQGEWVRSDDDMFTIRHAGGDMFGERERFHFVFQTLSGDGEIVARIDSLEAGGAAGWAGIAIRETTGDGKCKGAFLGFASGGGLIFVWYQDPWHPPGQVDTKSSMPRWLKLVRFGSLIKAYYSDDGQSWRPCGERGFQSLPPNMNVGMLVCCGSEEGGSARFEAVAVTRGSPRLESSVRGVVLRSGSILVGNPAFDGTSMKMWRGCDTVVPASQVARILFKPLTTEAAQRIEKRSSGLLLKNGDFIDGRIEAVRNREIRINSVLLGPRNYNLSSDELVAAVLREVSPDRCEFLVRAADGAIARAKRLEIEKGKLKAIDIFDVPILFPPSDILEIVPAGK